MRKKFGLFEGRHELPGVYNYVFDYSIEDVTDISAIRKQVSNILDEESSVALYVTGLTVALVEVINYCNENGVDLILYHYDRYSKQYYTQKISKC